MIDRPHLIQPDDTVHTVFHNLLQSFSPAQLHALVDDAVASTSQSRYPCPMGIQTPPASAPDAVDPTYTGSPGCTKGDGTQSASPSPKVRQRRRRRSSNNRRPAAPRSTPEQPSIPLAERDRRYLCGYCQEQGIHKPCTRRNDLKRHMGQYHILKKYNNDELFTCPYLDCGQVFDFASAHGNHTKEHHNQDCRDCRNEGPEVITCCTRTVFGCGFEGCMQVYEAESLDSLDVCVDRYLQHVVKHYTDLAVGGWTYSARIRSLLTQSATAEAWYRYIQVHGDHLTWDPQESVALRKILETRHFNNPEEVVQYAIAKSQAHIGSFNGPDFSFPILDQCSICSASSKAASPQHPVDGSPEQMEMFIHPYPSMPAPPCSGECCNPAPPPPPPAPPLHQSFDSLYLEKGHMNPGGYIYHGSPMMVGESPMVNGNPYFTVPETSDLV